MHIAQPLYNGLKRDTFRRRAAEGAPDKLPEERRGEEERGVPHELGLVVAQHQARQERDEAHDHHYARSYNAHLPHALRPHVTVEPESRGRNLGERGTAVGRVQVHWLGRLLSSLSRFNSKGVLVEQFLQEGLTALLKKYLMQLDARKVFSDACRQSKARYLLHPLCKADASQSARAGFPNRTCRVKTPGRRAQPGGGSWFWPHI